ncbi:MAG: DUF2071 domain-containing protein, partial [Planctomycetaceae bacterium]|nr:DUF2071 domain-containing protein [Planctomycetaceae bacterium]
PAVPGISWFLETNVRTYVRHTNGDTGVWFFSLDANSRLAVRIARTFWRLPYFYSRLKRLSDTTGKDESRTYTGSRADRQSTSYKIRIEFKPTEELQEAQDGTLEHFLLERYLLFAAGKTGSEIYSGRVHHVPYQFRKCTVHECSQQLLTASGITCDNGLPVHAAHSPGVEVVVSPLQKL